MKKTLITIGNYSKFVSGRKFFATKDMIITSGAKDKMNRESIMIVYEEESLEYKIKDILKNEYNITDALIIKKVMEKIASLK